MCGITGIIAKDRSKLYWELLDASEIRGQDGTGIASIRPDKLDFITARSNKKASESGQLEFGIYANDIIIGQNRLAIFGSDHKNDQPLVTDRYALVHNGNLVNFEERFEDYGLKREYQVDTELILRMIEMYDAKTPKDYIDIVYNLERKLEGNWACLLIDKKLNCLVAFTRFKPLFEYDNPVGIFFFSTERIGQKVFGKQEFTPINSVRIYTSSSG